MSSSCQLSLRTGGALRTTTSFTLGIPETAQVTADTGRSHVAGLLISVYAPEDLDTIVMD